MKTNLLRFLCVALALAFAVAAPASLLADETSARADAAAAELRGDSAQAAMTALDLEIDQLEVMMSNAPTAQDRAAGEARLQGLKNRRSELRKTYVKSRYDELKADVRAEANRLSAWTKHIGTRHSSGKATNSTNAMKRDVRTVSDHAYEGVSTAGAALDLEAYKLRPTNANQAEAKAALTALDARIDELGDRVDQMPSSADRDAAKRRVKALEDAKDELKHEFNKARFDALVDSVQSEWSRLIHRTITH